MVDCSRSGGYRRGREVGAESGWGERREDVSVGEHDAKRPNTADAPAVADERGVASPSVATFVALRPRRLLRLQSLANTLHLASEPSRNTRLDDVIQ